MDSDLELKRCQLQLVSHRGPLGREGRQWFRSELAAGPLFEKIIGNGWEQGECEKVLLTLGLVSRVPPRLWHFGFEEVSGALIDHPLIAQRPPADGFIDRAGRSPVEALEVMPGLRRDDLVALAGQDIERRLRAHDLT